MSMSSPSPEPKQRRPYRSFPVEDVLAAIKFHHGNISRIAEQFDVPRHQIYAKIYSKATLTQAWKNERERWKDLAESNVHIALVNGERWATMFVLTTIAKERGWALPKNALSEDVGSIEKVVVNSITIQGIEHNEFATRDTKSVEIKTIAAPPEPEDPDDSLIIEGELVEESDDAAS